LAPYFFYGPKVAPTFEILESPLNREVVLTLCYNDFTPTNICEMCLVLEHRQDKTDVKLIKNAGHFFVKRLAKTFSVDSPAQINNSVPAIQVRFQQFRVTERFCVEGSNKRSDRGALW